LRKLMCFALGFGAACALGVYLLPGWALILLAAAAVGVSFFAWIGSGKRKAAGAALIICIGALLAGIWYPVYDAVVLRDARQMDGVTADVMVELTGFSFESEYGITADGTVRLDGKNYRVRFYLNEKLTLAPGDKVTGGFRFRYTGYGGMDDPTYHSADRVFLLAYPDGEHEIIYEQSRQLKYAPAYLRQYLTELIGKLFPPDTVAFVKALLMGDTSELSYEVDSQLTVSGIRHIAAVSGLHVSILFSLVYLFTGKRRILSAAFGIPVLLVFAAMAGFSPSIIRACLMQILMLVALVFQKEYDPPTALSFAALTMLVINPLVITSVGFQLSVSSVAGIFLFAGRITRWFLEEKRFGKWKKHRLLYPILQKTATSIGVSLGALLLTTPLTAWYFGNVSLAGVLTNLLCLWVVTIVFCGIIAACILGTVFLPLGKAAAWLCGWLVRYVLAVSGVIARVPLASVYTESIYIVLWLIFCYVLFAVFLLSKEKRAVVLCCCAVIGLLTALLASWAEPLLDDYRVSVLDVGQGQCVLLQSEGRTYMVDCGGDYDENAADKAAAVLLSQGITRLDGLILSHYDRDHVGGARYLLTRIPTDVLILPEGSGAAQWESEIVKAHSGTPIRGSEDLQICWADAVITVFASQNRQTSNESSLCVLFHTEKCDILITGDRTTAGEELLLWHGDIPKLDALIVGHHGSGKSTGEALLAATQPKTAIISVGENSYGHPSEDVLERLVQYGCVIRRTDLEGTIILRG